MKYAIETLKQSLATLENNEPINRAEGKTEQADLEASGAAEIRQALVLLEAAQRAQFPIYPAGTTTTG